MAEVKFGDRVLQTAGTPVQTGTAALDAEVMNEELRRVHLADWAQDVRVILAVPSMDTGVCQAQVRYFNQAATKFEGVTVLAISMDLPFAQRRFCAAEGLDRVITLSDSVAADFGEKYGLLMTEVRLLQRAVFIIDREGIVRYAQYVPEVPQQVDFDAALAALKEIV